MYVADEKEVPMISRRATAMSLAAFLALAPVACDKEDKADVREGVNDVEDVIDDQVDTDGKDD